MRIFAFFFAIALISLIEAAKSPARSPQSNHLEQAKKILTFTCSAWEVDIPSKWIDIVQPCADAVERHIQANIDASFSYLVLASHFYTDTINRRYIAEFFLDSATDKRRVVRKLLGELLKRGALSIDSTCLLTCNNTITTINQWENGLEALKFALKLETDLTNRLRRVISTCQSNEMKFNDYKLVEVLSNKYLNHQYHGERFLAKKISSLGKVSHTNGQLGEFMFDKIIYNEKFLKNRATDFDHIVKKTSNDKKDKCSK